MSKVKVTLDTGKEIILRPLDIRTQRMAVQAASRAGGGDPILTQYLTQEEIFKQLLCEVDGKAPTEAQKETLDDLFTVGEYAQAIMALDEMVGKVGKPKLEAIS